MEKRLLTYSSLFSGSERSSSTLTSQSTMVETDDFAGRRALELLLKPLHGQSDMERGVALTAMKKVAASSEDILSPSINKLTSETSTRRSRRFSLDFLGGETHRHDAGLVERTARKLWTELTHYLYIKIIPQPSSGDLPRYSSQCFFGSEVAAALSEFLQERYPEETASVKSHRVNLLCLRLLLTEVIRDARKAQNLEFKKSRLYKFTSHSIKTFKEGPLWNISRTNTEETPAIAAHFKLHTTIHSILTKKIRTRNTSENSTETKDSYKQQDLSKNAMETTPQDPHGHINRQLSCIKRHRYHMFNPKGYPPIKIPLHTDTKPTNKTISDLPNNRNGHKKTDPIVNRDNSEITPCTDSNNDKDQWVVYGYI